MKAANNAVYIGQYPTRSFTIIVQSGDRKDSKCVTVKVPKTSAVRASVIAGRIADLLRQHNVEGA